MRRKPVIFLAALSIVVAILVGCNSGDEDTRSVVTVASINDNQPFFSDVLAQGDSVYDKSGVPITRDDYVVEDRVLVGFYNRPYNPFGTTAPGEPYGDFIVTSYRVEWERVDGGTEVPNTYVGGTSIVLPSGEITEGAILLVPFYEKNRPYLQELNYLGPRVGEEVLCIAHITFWGHEVGVPDREMSFKADLSVSFGDIVVRTHPDQEL